MKVAFLLRNKLIENRFRDVIINSLNCADIDNAILCSGFFQEDHSYSVSYSQFSKIKRSCHPLYLKTIGYYGNLSKHSYRNFISGINSLFCNQRITHQAFRVKGDKWHAKVFIGKSKDKPIVSIIGSSNLTRRAFDTIKNFNYECDVVFWDENNKHINKIINKVIGEEDDGTLSTVVLNIDENHPINKISISEKLINLENEILEQSVIFY